MNFFFLVIKASLSYFPFNSGQMRVLDTNLAIYHPHLLLFPIHYALISNGGPFQAVMQFLFLMHNMKFFSPNCTS